MRKPSRKSPTKKSFWMGFGAGAVLVFVTTLGLVIPGVGEVGRTLLIVPRAVLEFFIDTQHAPGLLNIGVLTLLSGLFYGGLASLMHFLRKV